MAVRHECDISRLRIRALVGTLGEGPKNDIASWERVAVGGRQPWAMVVSVALGLTALAAGQAGAEPWRIETLAPAGARPTFAEGLAPDPGFSMSGPQVAIGAGGRPVVGWQEGKRFFVDAGATARSRPAALAPVSYSGGFSIAANRRGDMGFSWAQRTGVLPVYALRARWHPAGRTWMASESIAQTASDSVGQVGPHGASLSVDSAGRARALWSWTDDGPDLRELSWVAAARRSRAPGRWQPPVGLAETPLPSLLGGAVASPGLVTSRSGVVAAVQEQVPGFGSGTALFIVADRGQGWQRSESVDLPGQPVARASLSASPDGAGLISWARGSDRGTTWARSFDVASGEFGDSFRVTTGADSYPPSVHAVSDSGRAAIVFSKPDGERTPTIWARVRGPEGSADFADPVRLSRADRTMRLVRVSSVAANSRGDLAVAWTEARGDGHADTLVVARRDALTGRWTRSVVVRGRPGVSIGAQLALTPAGWKYPGLTDTQSGAILIASERSPDATCTSTGVPSARNRFGTIAREANRPDRRRSGHL